MPEEPAAKKIIGISACLAGWQTRYDGGDKRDEALLGLLASHGVELVTLCPVAECGLGIPREPMRREGNPKNPRLN